MIREPKTFAQISVETYVLRLVCRNLAGSLQEPRRHHVSERKTLAPRLRPASHALRFGGARPAERIRAVRRRRHLALRLRPHQRASPAHAALSRREILARGSLALSAPSRFRVHQRRE